MPVRLTALPAKRRWPAILSGIALFVLVALIGSGGLLYAAHQEENDAFCASCHTQPETTYFARTQDAKATDLASWHHGKAGQSGQVTRCIDCHSGAGVSGRLNAMQIGSVDLIAYVTGQAKQPAPLTHPITDANCLKCHADVPTTQNFNRHFHTFLTRWQAADPKAASCVSCHAAHATDGLPNLVFLQRERAVQVCDNCHKVLRRG